MCIIIGVELSSACVYGNFLGYVVVVIALQSCELVQYNMRFLRSCTQRTWISAAQGFAHLQENKRTFLCYTLYEFYLCANCRNTVLNVLISGAARHPHGPDGGRHCGLGDSSTVWGATSRQDVVSHQRCQSTRRKE